MLSKYDPTMDTNQFLLVDFTIMALYVIETTNKITNTSSFRSIHIENGKYIEIFRSSVQYFLKREIKL